jgi:hypothetical protein
MAMHKQRRIAKEPECIVLNEHICAAEASSGTLKLVLETPWRGD